MASSMFESIKLVFVSLFTFIKHWKHTHHLSEAGQNPHPFGTREWSNFVAAQATDKERMALKIADLEAQVHQATELVGSLEAVASHQEKIISDLRLQNKILRDGPDPEVFQRIWEDIHAPTKEPAPPGGPEPDSPGPSSAPHSSVAESSQASDDDAKPSEGTAIGSKSTARSGPLTLAEELEGHLDEESEDESEDGDS